MQLHMAKVHGTTLMFCCKWALYWPRFGFASHFHLHIGQLGSLRQTCNNRPNRGAEERSIGLEAALQSKQAQSRKPASPSCPMPKAVGIVFTHRARSSLSISVLFVEHVFVYYNQHGTNTQHWEICGNTTKTMLGGPEKVSIYMYRKIVTTTGLHICSQLPKVPGSGSGHFWGETDT